MAICLLLFVLSSSTITIHYIDSSIILETFNTTPMLFLLAGVGILSILSILYSGNKFGNYNTGINI